MAEEKNKKASFNPKKIYELLVKNKLIVSLGLVLIIFYSFFVGLVVLLISDYDADNLENRLSSDTQEASYVVEAVPSKETIVEEKVVADKLNLERKVIVPDNPNQAEQIRQIIEEENGTVEESNENTIVANIPKESEENINNRFEESQIESTVEVDYPVFLTADSRDWGVERIEAPDVWDTTTAGGVGIAVIDTGIDYTHPDLANRYAGGIDIVNQDDDPFDDHGHGTHVSGIASSALDDQGYAGVAPGASIYGVKVLASDGSGYISDLVEGIDWAIENNVAIINMSLGTTYDSSVLESKINEAASQGSMIVAAAGNNSGGSLLYPAAYGSVVAVGATDSNDNLASFSALGSEIVAPGVSVTSTVPGGGYQSWSGTSMASPHVAATAALMMANDQENIREALRNTAIDLGESGADSNFGYGLVYSKPAALGEDVLAPVVSFIEPSNNSIVKGDVLVALDVQDEYEITNVNLLINNTIVESWTEPSYEYLWNTDSIEEGNYELLVRATDEFDNTGEAKINVEVSRTINPTATPSPTLPISQGRSQEFRQDTQQEQAQENRQNRERSGRNQSNQSNQSQDSAQEENDSTTQAESSAPDVTNLNQRNPKNNSPDNPGSSNEDRGQGRGRGVRGVQADESGIFSTVINFFQQIFR